MNEAYLCLGGNLGNCIATFKEAILCINGLGGTIVARSAIYKTQAWGMDKAAPDFYNQVIKIKTNASALELMMCLLEIEKKLGRQRTGESGYQNRVIDMDILFFNNDIIKTEMLEIPHPRMQQRRFVLLPLSEIAPTFIHPVLHKDVVSLLLQCEDISAVEKITT